MTDLNETITDIRGLWRSPRSARRGRPRQLDLELRQATPDDGLGMWRVVRDSQVLDVNSPYAYVLMCDQFGDTCVVAEHEGEVAGFVTGFRPPNALDVIFVWQIGVSEKARGQGLARRILLHLVRSEGCRGVKFMETTITPSNRASRRLFRSFARHVNADVRVGHGFGGDLLAPDPTGHEAEELFRIGPFEIPGMDAKEEA